MSVDLQALRERAEARDPGDTFGIWVPKEDVLALVEAARALWSSGWNDSDGKCWCARSVEETGWDHLPRCIRARRALDAFTDECLHSSPGPDSPAPDHGSAGQ